MTLMKTILNSLIALTLFVAVTGVAQASPAVSVPDAGSTSALFAIALGGLTFVRRFAR